MSYTFNHNSRRLVKARLGIWAGTWFFVTGLIIGTGLLAAAVFLLVSGERSGYSALGLVLLIGIFLTWLAEDLHKLPPTPVGSTVMELDQLLPARLAARLPWPASSNQIWGLIQKSWKVHFMMIRLGLPPDEIAAGLGDINDTTWHTAHEFAKEAKLTSLDEGALMTALLVTSPALRLVLTAHKLETNDIISVLEWLGRLERLDGHEPRFLGGIARDWASGYTPLLDRFGVNFSDFVNQNGQRYETLAASTAANGVIKALSEQPRCIVVTGPTGVGKTALLQAVAERLLGGDGGSLAYQQVVGLNASLILSRAQTDGNLEGLVLNILGEAVAAGNIILTLDEAQLFFGRGTGAVDLSQILLPVLQSGRLRLVLTMTPDHWQRLIATNATLAGQITRINMPEPPEAEVLRLLEDAAMALEVRSHLFVTLSAIKAAYNLSSRYNTDEAYPGRALKLLDAAMGQPDGQFIDQSSVERAVEATYGVKSGTAAGVESATLLNLEEQIHQRMINQSRAVTVVASALRRARAGVANPKRPIGSFLFLGPTGVGKTELARSLAAVYFRDEANMIRLDMSEYQQADDVKRILGDTGSVAASLLLSLRQRPFSVVLLDEIEKAHPDILNLLLQLLDEGRLTDVGGRTISFKDAIIIATSNAGADEIRQHIAAGEDLEKFEKPFIDNLINSGSFKAELLNRFDEIVLFRPLKQDELAQVVELMIAEVNRTLTNQKISVELTPAAVTKLVDEGNDPRLGARPMRRAVQRLVENVVANKVLRGEVQPGSVIKLDAGDLDET